MISIGIFNIVSVIGLLLSVTIAYRQFILGKRRETREWCYDMHQFSKKVLPFTPLEAQSNYEALGRDADAYIESYRGPIEAIPDRMNEDRFDAPDTVQLTGSIIECLYTESKNIKKRIDRLEEGSEFQFYEFLESIGVMHAASLAISHELEEEIITTVSRSDLLILMVRSTYQKDINFLNTIKVVYDFEFNDENKGEILLLLSNWECKSFKPLPSLSKNHAESLYEDFQGKTHTIGSIRRSLLDSYMKTYNKPWISPLVRTSSRYR